MYKLVFPSKKLTEIFAARYIKNQYTINLTFCTLTLNDDVHPYRNVYFIYQDFLKQNEPKNL